MKSISLTLNVNFEFPLKMCEVCYKFAGTYKYFLHTEELQAKKTFELRAKSNFAYSLHFHKFIADSLLKMPQYQYFYNVMCIWDSVLIFIQPLQKDAHTCQWRIQDFPDGEGAPTPNGEGAPTYHFG